MSAATVAITLQRSLQAAYTEAEGAGPKRCTQWIGQLSHPARKDAKNSPWGDVGATLTADINNIIVCIGTKMPQHVWPHLA